MSVYVVNVTETSQQGHQENSVLRSLAQAFHGSVYHRDGGHGSFMVHEVEGMNPEDQITMFRDHLRAAGMAFAELRNVSGHTVFEVDVTGQRDMARTQMQYDMNSGFLGCRVPR